MNAAEFRLIVDKLADGLTRDQKLAIFNRTLGWLTADVSDGKGERRLRLMIATQIRVAIREQVEQYEPPWEPEMERLEGLKADQAYDDHISRETEPKL